MGILSILLKCRKTNSVYSFEMVCFFWGREKGEGGKGEGGGGRSLGMKCFSGCRAKCMSKHRTYKAGSGVMNCVVDVHYRVIQY